MLLMIEPILHLFRIQRKVCFGNPSVVVELVFSKAPEILNSVNVIMSWFDKDL